MDEEVEAGKAVFLEIIRQIDPDIQVVIPSRATGDQFLISLTQGGGREFINISEGDLLDLEEVPEVKKEVLEKIQEALAKLGN